MDFSHIITDDPTMRNVVSDRRFERKPTQVDRKCHLMKG